MAGVIMTSMSEKGSVRPFIPAPENTEELGLDFGLLLDLCLKTLYYMGRPSARQICSRMCLAFSIVDDLLTFLRRQEFVDIVGSDGAGETEYLYSMTSKGLERAREALEVNQYVGPAPVSFEDYVEMVRRQTITNITLTPVGVSKALDHLILPDTTKDQVGAAVVSGSSLFLFGEPGNGKSAISEAIGDMLMESVFIPHAIEVHGQIVRLYDPRIHHEVQTAPEKSDDPLSFGRGFLNGEHDARWVLAKRPLIIVGGELSMTDLDLRYSPLSRFYIAPLQLKANGGVLVIDDFGRQLMRPEELLNRWMVPMERRTDHLTFHTGETIQVPFDVLLVFSSNLSPSSLGDEAFLRRIRHKVRVSDPTEEEFRQILARMARRYDVRLEDEAVDYFITRYYREQNRPLRSVHPRDILALILDAARFQDKLPEFNKATIDAACAAYFAIM